MTDDGRLQALSAERRELLKLLLEEEASVRPDAFPLSFAQERMWVSEKLAAGGAYTTSIHIEGRLDVGAMRRAVDEVVRRHHVLRSTFRDEPSPAQVVGPHVAVPMPLLDLRPFGADEQRAQVERLSGEESRRPFDLRSGPLLRLQLLQLADEQHLVLFSVHHLVFDGWSGRLFCEEVGALYDAFSRGHPSPLPELARQYGDYAAWQRSWAETAEAREHVAYWSKKLAGDLPVLGLPTDHPRPEQRTFRGSLHAFELPAELYLGVERLSRDEGVTPFMTLLAGFLALLHRWTGQEDLVVASPVANRTRAEDEPLIGCFMQPLVLRTVLAGDPAFREVLGRVRQVCLEGYAHQDAPFEEIVRAVRPQWDGRNLPLFQVLFNVQKTEITPFRLPGLTFTPTMASPSSALDMSVHLWTGGQRVRGEWEFATELFEPATVAWLVESYQALLASVVADPARRLSVLSARPSDRRQLLELMLAEESGRPATDAIRPRTRDGGSLPASSGQERLWFFDRLDPGTTVFNETEVLRLDGPLDVGALERAWQEIVRRHEMLRTGFVVEEGRPRQVIAASLDVSLPVVDVSRAAPDAEAAAIRRAIDESAARPFDLSRPPLLRVQLLRSSATEHRLVLTMHHIAADGWSREVFLRELAALYDAFSAGRPSPLPELPVQYADYALWQRERFQGAVLHEHLSYWKRQLGGELPVLELPADRPPAEGRPAARGALEPFQVPDAVYRQLRDLGRDEGATPFMALLAAFQALLYRYTGQDDVLVDTVVAGRDREELAPLLGFFVNSLLLRTDLSGDPSFRELLARVRGVCLGAYEHQELPFDKVVSEIAPARRGRAGPLTPASFMLHDAVGDTRALGPSVTATSVELHASDEFDLTLLMWQGRDGLTGHFKYDPDLFDRGTIRRMAGHFQVLLAAAVADPSRRLGEMPLLPPDERETLLVSWNRTAERLGPEGTLVHELFEASAEKTPGATAVAMAGQADGLTYGELDRRANQLAHLLRSYGVGPEVRVGLFVDRSLAAPIGLLAILKAGGAYVPLDPRLPRARLSFLLEDTRPRVIVTRERLLGELPEHPAQVVCVDADHALIAEQPDDRAVAAVDPEAPAYVLHTSGSTGQPKGVAVPHRAVVNHNRAAARRFGLTPGDRVLQFHSIGFDAAVEEIFPTWAAGATLVWRGDDLPAVGAEWGRLIGQERITVLNLPTAYWHEWMAEAGESRRAPPASLRLVIVGGEKASAERYRTWCDLTGGRARWLNTYGPTEATVICTWHEPAPGESLDGRAPALGRPLPNTQVYVLDARMQPVPIGAAGELYVGGHGVARGYLGRPELTASRFVADPFSGIPGARLYRTGDRVRHRPDGCLEFLGRIDDQVKIRGFRVEPGEIEAVLLTHPSVAQAAVAPWPVSETETRLAAYVVPHEAGAAEALAGDLRSFLQAKLPAYMVPAAFVALEALPVTAAGKVNRRALPAPEPRRLEPHAFVPPRTPAEVMLAGLWSQVLGVGTIGADDDFFALGGHSLLAAQLVSRIHAACGVEIPLRAVFEAPTVAGLARRIDAAGGEPRARERAIERQPRNGAMPVSFAQERMWISQRLSEAPATGSTAAVYLDGALDVGALRETFDEIVRRHEILRTSFPSRAGHPVQVVASAPPEGVLAVVDLAELGERDAGSEVDRLVADYARRPVDLERGPILRTSLLRLDERRHLFVMSAPHLVYDGWSARVLRDEIATLYDAIARGQPSPLPELPIQYADYAHWQRSLGEGGAMGDALSFWTRKLARPLPALRLPADRVAPPRRTFETSSVWFDLPASAYRALEALGRQDGATPFMTLLAVFLALVRGVTAQDDLVVGSPVANRGRVETEPLIGCFMQPVALRTDLSGDPTFRELLARVREVCLEAYAHQDVPFEWIVRELQPKWDLGRLPLFQVVFNVEQTKPAAERADLAFRPRDVERATSPLDLTVHLAIQGDAVRGRWEYATELFDGSTIEWLARGFETLLERVVEEPSRRLSSLAQEGLPPRRERSRERRELLALLLADEGAPGADEAITRRSGDGQPLVASFGQERLWFFDQLEPGSTAFNESQVLRLEGPLDIGALERAGNEIVRRQETLRTRFVAEAGHPRPVVVDGVTLALPVVDLGGLPPDAREAATRPLLDEQARLAFDLARPPLLRWLLLRYGDADHVLVITAHHIAVDGSSVDVFQRELATLYEAYALGRPSPLPELPVRYTDYAAWQRERFQGARLDEALAYWKEHLGGDLPALDLPTARPRGPRRAGERGALEAFEVPAPVFRALRDLGRQEGATLFMTLLAAYQALLFRYTGMDDVLVDTVVAGRDREELSGLVGFFANSLVLRTGLGGEPTFRALLSRVRRVCLGAYEHQELPFDRVVTALAPESHRGRRLTPVSFMLHDALSEGRDLGAGVRLVPLGLQIDDEFDLTLFLWQSKDGLSGHFKYDRALFDQPTIQRMAGHFQRLLESAVGDPDAKLGDLELMPAAERDEVLVAWNATDEERVPGQCVHELFEARVRATPDAVAVTLPVREQTEGRQPALTYEDLDRRANRLAHRLIAAGAGPERRVGLCLDRSVEMTVAVLGILKSGAAYVPLDPSYPRERLASLGRQAGLSALVTREALQPLLPDLDATVVSLDTDAGLALQPDDKPAVALGADSPAYVIYTSGSTGEPKGVVVPHRSVVNHNVSVAKAFGLTPRDRVLQFHSISFDAAVEELFPTWWAGATLVLRRVDLVAPGDELHRLIEDEQLSVLNLPTAYWHEWVSEIARTRRAPPPPLRLVIAGGERASRDRYRTWREATGARVRWLNTYGPTETTVISTWDEPGDEDDGGEMAIGRPLPNTQAYVLDGRLRPVPVGVTGELYVGGAGVARGYLGRPDLTAERFVPDPFGGRPGARLYRTGDRARYRADGRLECRGRLDEQVKIRGFRIEPAEIEAALREHPFVSQAVVQARKVSETETRLVAYVVPQSDSAGPAEPLAPELLRFLHGRLPAYMTPSAIVRLEALPMTPSGKVDRKALPDPETMGEPRSNLARPRTPTEELVAGIWSQVLSAGDVNVDDDFFALGGHSLKASEVIYRIREAFGIDLPLRSVFEAPTVGGLAGRVDEAVRAGAGAPLSRIVPAPRTGPLPLSYAQEGAWWIDRLQPGTPFNVPIPLRLQGDLNLEALSAALDEVVRRHEVLRTRFPSADGQPSQEIGDVQPVPVPLVDLGELPEGTRDAELVRRLGEQSLQPFDLAGGPLFRVTVFRLADRDHVVLFTAHHAVFDGWSVNVLAREVAEGYAARQAGRPARLPPLPIQYADYAVWQRQVVQGELVESHVRYWKDTLAGSPSTLSLPTDRPPSTDRLFHGDAVSFALPRALSDALRATTRSEGVTLFMLLLAAFQSLLARQSGQDDLVVGTPVANRSQPELQSLIGFCVNVLPLRTDLSGDPSFRDVLGRVRETCLGAFSHQEVPFGVMVERLAPDRHVSHSPIFQAQFALQTVAADSVQLPDLHIRPLAAADAFADQLRTLLVETTPASDLLYLQMVDSGTDLTGVILFRSDLFERSTIRRLAGHFERLLESVAARPDGSLWDLDLMPAAERREVIEVWNATDEDRAPGRCVHELFEARAREMPDAVAVTLSGRERSDGRKPGLTYGELDRRANQVAHRLRSLGVGPEQRVGICLDRSLEMAVAVLGILKSGAAYVPLDPGYPRGRLAFLARSARLSALVTRDALTAVLPPLGVAVLCLDTDAALAAQPDDKPAVAIDADGPAYVIYTSGSTGEPKGVVVAHRSVVNHNVSVAKVFGLTARDRVLQFHSISFDAAVEELFPTWWAGATLVLRGAGLVTPGEELHRLIEDEQLTVLNLPTAYWHEWASELGRTDGAPPAPLRLVIAGGERAARDRYRTWRERTGARVRWLNTYGPTETTVISTWDEPGDADDAREMAIGRPLPNTRTYVLDERLRPVPVGVVGELYIGGEGVARGYLGRPDLTAERFVPDPFSGESGARLYRTGDRARYRADGRLECLGRLDEQVKIRGYRIEPAEIEAVLSRCPGVRDAAVVAVDDAAGKRLVAFVAAPQGHTATPTGLREYLESHLPAHMVPSAFVGLDRLPRTPSGKADRRALSAVAVPRQGFDDAYVAPGTATEERLAGVWSELLAVDRVGIHDDFFRLGGHSLLAARLVARVGAELGVELPLRVFVERPTVAAVARFVDAAAPSPAGLSAHPGLVVIQRGGSRRPLFLLPAADGSVACYLDLVRHLDPELPVFGIVLPEPSDAAAAAPRIEALAAHAIEAIAAIQPEGPYHLGGWSWGGIVAYEAARQLRERGESVGLLALFDAWALDRSSAHRAARAFEPASAVLGVSLDEWLRWTPEQRSMRLIDRLRTAHGPLDRVLVRMADELGLPFDQFVVLLEEVLPEGSELREVVAEAARAHGLPSDARRRELRDKMSVLQANLSALAEYRLRPYDGALTVFPAGMRSAEDLSLGWKGLASGGVDVRAVPGHHYTMLREPHVRALAEKLRASLDAPVETT